MANTRYVTSNRLSTEADKSRQHVLIIGIPAVLLLSFMFPVAWWFFTIFLIITFLNAGSTKRAGARGEDATLAMLSSLPDSYTIINQILVPDQRSRTGFTELDFVVLGPNGVFVIEVKNNNSRKVGSEKDRQWTVYKVGRKGTPYTATIRNPIKQLKGQIWVLSNFIRERGYKIWVDGVVFFSNPDSSLELNGRPSVPVIHAKGLTDYILKHEPRWTSKNVDGFVKDLASLKRLPNIKQ